jgi:hypothetical protein
MFSTSVVATEVYLYLGVLEWIHHSMEDGITDVLCQDTLSAMPLDVGFASGEIEPT